MAKTKAEKLALETDKAEALEKLRKHLKPGARVYTAVQHVNRTGDMRVISCFLAYVDAKGEADIFPISGWVAAATGRKFDVSRGGVICHGGGMDMTFELVYRLGTVLFPEGGPARASTNRTRSRTAVHESNGGYLLNRVAL